jgi:hypothetical protein
VIVKNEMERAGKEMAVVYSGICIEELSETLHYIQ